jgi:Nuclease-related domain
MKISGRRGALTDRHIRRYGKIVGIGIVLTLLVFGASRYIEMPFASFGALAFLLILTKLSYFHWERWFLGKDAAARVTEALEALSNEYVVLTDLVLPDSKGSIDHLLVGPNGLFVIETKRYPGFVTCDEDRWFLNGHPLRSLSKEVKRNSLAVRSSIGTLFAPPATQIPYVTPLLVFVGFQTKLKLSKPTLPVLKPKELGKYIRDCQPKRTITQYEQRSIVYHLHSLQPGFEDALDPIEAAEDDKKIA